MKKMKTTWLSALSAMCLVGVSSHALAAGAPTVSDFSGTVEYSEGQAPILVDEDFTVAKPSGGKITAVMARITNPQEGGNEILEVNAGGSNLQVNRVNGAVVVSGNASDAEYSRVLQTLTYSSSEPRLFGDSRNVEIVASSGPRIDIASKQIILNGAAPVVQAEEPVYTPPASRGVSLREAMAKSYSCNENLKAKRASVRVLDENVADAIGDWLPVASADLARGWERVDRDGFKNTDDIESDSVSLTWSLFSSGQSLAKYKREKNKVLSARAQLEQDEQELLMDVVTAYMDTLRDQEVLILSRETEDVLKKHVEETELRFSLGEVTQTDVFQSKSRYLRAKGARIDAEKQLAGSSAVYERYICELPQGPFLEPSPLPADLNETELVAEALRVHPVIRSAELNAKAGKHDVQHFERKLLPDLSFQASASRKEGGFIGTGVSEIETHRALFNLHIPIFQGGKEYAAIRQAKRRREEAQYELADQRYIVQAGVKRTLNEFIASRKNIQGYREQVANSESALEGVVNEAKLGARTTIDVLDAENELLDSKIKLVVAQRDEVVAAYELLSSLGRLTAVEMQLPVEIYDPAVYHRRALWVVGF